MLEMNVGEKYEVSWKNHGPIFSSYLHLNHFLLDNVDRLSQTCCFSVLEDFSFICILILLKSWNVSLFCQTAILYTRWRMEFWESRNFITMVLNLTNREMVGQWHLGALRPLALWRWHGSTWKVDHSDQVLPPIANVGNFGDWHDLMYYLDSQFLSLCFYKIETVL